MSPRLQGIIAVQLVVGDGGRLADFYVQALSAELAGRAPIPEAEAAILGEGERWTLQVGAQRLQLDAFTSRGAPYPSDIAADDPRFQHMAVVCADIDRAFDRVMAAGAQLISHAERPVRLPASSGGATAIKLRDVEGHPFELIALTGPEWTAVPPNAHGVRGLDHSAITVGDLQAAMRFYEGLGLERRGGSFNHGPEQAALDGLASPEVDVAPLFAPAAPPHLELLAYRRGLAAPALPVGDRDGAATRIAWRASGVDAPALLHDPCGHRHLLIPFPGASAP